MSVKNIYDNITIVIKDANLKQIANEFTETIVDNNLAEGLLKQLPVTNILVGSFKGYKSIQDAIFMTKLSAFLKEIKDVSLEQREEMVAKIESSVGHRTKIGETIFYIIDKCDDPEKAQLNAVLLKAVAQKKITYDDFLRGSLIIRKCLLSELKWFIKSTVTSYDMRLNAELFNWGLLEFAPLELKIGNKRNSSSGFEITNKALKLKLSPSGKVLRSCLKDFLIEQFKELKLTEKNLDFLINYVNSLEKDTENDVSGERIYSCVVDLIFEVCNNYILDESEIQIVFSHCIDKLGKHSINALNRLIEIKRIEVTKTNNEFNVNRWINFSQEFARHQ